jgi:hypothetical protein
LRLARAATEQRHRSGAEPCRRFQCSEIGVVAKPL